MLHLPVATAEPPIRVLVVDDEPTARQRMVRLLSRVPGVTVVGVCSSGREAEVVLDTGTRLPVSRTFRSALESVWREGSTSAQ